LEQARVEDRISSLDKEDQMDMKGAMMWEKRQKHPWYHKAKADDEDEDDNIYILSCVWKEPSSWTCQLGYFKV
jgi:hypothetical protein